MKKAAIVVILVLIIDQAFKFAVKLNMFLGQEVNVLGKWFIIHFTENNGIAFGIEFPFIGGKLLLTIFRIIASIGIGWYLYKICKKKESTLLIISVSLILAGAVGNIIDSAFYGLIFNDSTFQVATLFPKGGGYGTFLHGQVVDMLYFPIIQSHFPHWFPFWGGKEFQFFSPVFNIADSSITVGVFMLLIFQKKFFGPKEVNKEQPAEA